MFDKLYQADWKPERSKNSQASVKAITSNPPAQKPAEYRLPHAKAAAAVQAQLFGESPAETLSKNALRNKKKREKKKAGEATGGA